MKAVFVLFDSLNRNALSCYNAAAAQTPNFDRLARHGARLDNHYVGSLPCMPARRDLLTGRLNFVVLYDLQRDPAQQAPVAHEAVEQRFVQVMAELMARNDAPNELYERFALSG